MDIIKHTNPLAGKCVTGSDLQSDVYLMDCMDFMKDVPDKYFDLAVVDPPYGIGESNKQRKNTPSKKWKSAKNDIPYKKKIWDNTVPSAEYFYELLRVSKNQIVWGGNYMTQFLPPSMGWIFWDKKTGIPIFLTVNWHGHLLIKL